MKVQKRFFSDLTRQDLGGVDRSTKMTPFLVEDPWEYNVRDEEYKEFKLGSYHHKSGKNAKALIFFIPDFAVTARSFGSFFESFASDSELLLQTYSFDRRGFGKS